MKRKSKQKSDWSAMPRWTDNGNLPMCSEGACPEFDGKRCKILGNRPGAICEPAVIEVLAAVRVGKCPCETDLEGAPPWHLPSCPRSDPAFDEGGVL